MKKNTNYPMWGGNKWKSQCLKNIGGMFVL